MADFKRKLCFKDKFLFMVIFKIFLMTDSFSADKETGVLYYE